MKQAFILVILALLALPSCKKKDGTGTVETAKVKTLTETVAGSVITTTYSYNSNGSIARMDASDGSSIVYTYPTGTVIQMTYNNMGTMIDSFTYYLNTEGFADTAIMVSGGNYFYKKYFYDGNGYVILTKNYDATNFLQSVDSASIVNGNVIVRVITDDLGNGLSQTNYAYDNAHISSINSRNQGQGFAGNGSKNLLTEAQTVYNAGGGVSFVFQYLLDDIGRVQTMQTFNAGGTLIATGAYTYY